MDNKTCGECKYLVEKKGYCRLLDMVDICYSEDACGVFEAANAPAESERKMDKTCPRCGKTNSQDLYNGFWHCRECCKIFSEREAAATVAKLKEVYNG